MLRGSQTIILYCIVYFIFLLRCGNLTLFTNGRLFVNMEREEGEMSDDNYMAVDSEDEQIPNSNQMDTGDMTIILSLPEKKTLVEKIEIADVQRLEERAKKFGLTLFSTRAITQKQIDELYNNFIKDGNERHFRFDTLHLRGVDDLTTKEIFEYLEDYKPVSLEWVDKSSCNVVCHDNITAALAMLAHSREIKDENLKRMLQDIDDKYWREGFPHPDKDLILFRFATNSDKKDFKIKSELNLIKRPNKAIETKVKDSKNPWGDLCSSWGIYDHQEVFLRKLPYDVEVEEEEVDEEVVKVKSKRLAKRLGKRKQIEESDDSSSDAEWKSKSKAPRMRMHADDIPEKSITQIKNEEDDSHFDATLSIEFENHKTSYAPRQISKLSDKFKVRKDEKSRGKERRNVKSRLGVKTNEAEDCLTDDSDVGIRLGIRAHKLHSTIESHSSTVWSRLDSKISESTSRCDLREKLKSKKDDLRKRIPNPRNDKGRIRIEFDNDSYNHSD